MRDLDGGLVMLFVLLAAHGLTGLRLAWRDPVPRFVRWLRVCDLLLMLAFVSAVVLEFERRALLALTAALLIVGLASRWLSWRITRRPPVDAPDSVRS